ncbi:MAG: ATP-binding cassette domain-containing protein [Sphaerobacteraceae bacterium]|nr:MAG: ATP-binding cassette domain-containing protein [Sphaerobacteraceae bacterium]
MTGPILSVSDLSVIHGNECPDCRTSTGPEVGTNTCASCGAVVACTDVSFDVYPGQVLGIVGESGSGKSTVLQCIYQDLAPTRGDALFAEFEQGDRSIWQANRRQRRELRTYSMGMVYQNPRQGLNLLVTAGGNIAERLLAADWRRVEDIRDTASHFLNRTEVPINRMDDFPAFFSGGMQQRVQIAKALANNPTLMLLDEPTTGLDVSVQAGVLDLLREIQSSKGMTVIVVSHDLAVIRLLADRTLVMRHGQVVESGLTDQILEDPQHSYTQLLVNSAA